MKIENIYFKRPFKTRNADEYDLSQILQLFVSPLSGLTTPFDYENNIIKGRMGSGKTMYLRANHAFYLYSLVPSILKNRELILPVLIRLSDFQHIKEPSEIYKAIIVRIIEELSSIYLHLQDAEKLAKIHLGMKSLTSNLLVSQKFSSAILQLTKLGADEYVEKISNELGIRGGVKPKFFELFAEYSQKNVVEVKQKANPGIKDVEEAYKNLLQSYKGKILLLIDEAGSLDRAFFRGKNNDSFFEILMNQFRTAEFIRTKIAIYPNSFQDILTETRYGDIVRLEEDILDQTGYVNFRTKALDIIFNYINTDEQEIITPEGLFELLPEKEKYGDCLEQLINASNGNLRRLIQLFDAAMDVAYSDHKGKCRITLEHTNSALAKHSQVTEGLYTEPEREMLESIMQACTSRSTYRFQFPNMSIALNKYTSRSQEYNLINVVEIGSGRKGTIYSFDYCYCIAHDIPTHYITGSEKINRNRTLRDGRWVTRVAQISEEILQHACITSKIDGAIEYYADTSGLIQGDNKETYFFRDSYIIEEDKKQQIIQGRRVRFIPFNFGGTTIAQAIEIL